MEKIDVKDLRKRHSLIIPTKGKDIKSVYSNQILSTLVGKQRAKDAMQVLSQIVY